MPGTCQFVVDDGGDLDAISTVERAALDAVAQGALAINIDLVTDGDWIANGAVVALVVAAGRIRTAGASVALTGQATGRVHHAAHLAGLDSLFAGAQARTEPVQQPQQS